MKQTITLMPGASGPVQFTVSPAEADQYTVSLAGFSRNFTATVQLANLYCTVRDGVGNRLQGALVELNGDVAYTNSWGECEFTNKPVGSYTLTVSKSGYPTKSQTVHLSSGNNYEDITLQAQEANFQITDLTVNPSQVYVGESVTIGVEVENIGDAAGTCTVGTDPTSDFVMSISPGTWSPALVPAVYAPAIDITPIISLMVVMMMMSMATKMMK